MTQSEIWESFDYNPLTGELRWKVNRPRRPPLIGKQAGCIAENGYRVLRYKNKTYKAHRIIYQFIYGKLPTHTIDHADRDRSNNAVNNLSDKTLLEQAQNRDNSNLHTHKSITLKHSVTGEILTFASGVSACKTLGFSQSGLSQVRTRTIDSIKGWKLND